MIYTIKHGDTLSELAVRFKTTTAQLAKDNNIADPNRIYAGHTLVVPGAEPGIWNLWDYLKKLLLNPLG
jgi:LysM repeat protein